MFCVKQVGCCFRGLVEALLVHLDAQRSRKEDGPVVQRLWIQVGTTFYFGQVFVRARAVQAGLIQILHGPYENAGLAAYGGPQTAEIAAGLGSEKQYGLLSLRRNGDENAFRFYLLGPCLRSREPILGRRVSGAPQERDHQQIMRGLIVGKINVDPQPVSRQQVGHVRDTEFISGAGYIDFQFGSGQIESVIGLSESSLRDSQQGEQPILD